MTRRDRITLLLEHYQAVMEGLPGIEEPDDSDVLALMCEEWNHPSYQQLERLLRVMHERWPVLRVALRMRYERYSERRVAWCPKCGVTEPAARIGSAHKNPCRDRRNHLVDMSVRIVRSSPQVRHETEAVDWLDRHWRGDAAVPDAILRYHSLEQLRVAS